LKLTNGLKSKEEGRTEWNCAFDNVRCKRKRVKDGEGRGEEGGSVKK
jgi:hypothetical protein